MVGLSGMPASGASLLLNAEGVLTALIAWCVFRENFDRRIALGMLAIVAGVLDQCRRQGDEWMRQSGARPRSLWGAAVILAIWTAAGWALWSWWVEAR